MTATGGSSRRPGGPLRAAIVGAGLMGRWHADAVRRTGGRVTMVLDTNAERAGRLASRHPGAVTGTSLAPLLADGADVAHICTPLGSHTELVALALDAGCHVLVEKPLAPTVAETEALLDRASQQGRLLCPVHQFLFQRGVGQAFARVPSMGAVVHVGFTMCSAGADGRGEAEADRIALEILPHPLSVLARVFPMPLRATGWRVVRPAPGEVRVSGVAGSASIGILISMRGRPTVNEMELVMERGTLRVDLYHGYMVEEGGVVSRTRKMTRPLVLAGRTAAAAGWNLARRATDREPAYPGLRTLVGEFYEAVRTGSASPVGSNEAMWVSRVVDSVRLTPKEL